MPQEPIQSLTEYYQRRNEEGKRHQQAVAGLEIALRDFQSRCRHERTRFQADPAGGSDSDIICLDCDKSV